MNVDIEVEKVKLPDNTDDSNQVSLSPRGHVFICSRSSLVVILDVFFCCRASTEESRPEDTGAAFLQSATLSVKHILMTWDRILWAAGFYGSRNGGSLCKKGASKQNQCLMY